MVRKDGWRGKESAAAPQRRAQTQSHVSKERTRQQQQTPLACTAPVLTAVPLSNSSYNILISELDIWCVFKGELKHGIPGFL